MRVDNFFMGERLRHVIKSALGFCLLALAGCGSVSQDQSVQVAEQADPGLRVELANPGFELWDESKICPTGWSCSQHTGELSFTFKPDRSDKVDGTTSMRVERIGSQPWGAVRQRINPELVRGQYVRFSARVKLAGVTGLGAGIMIVTSGSVKTSAPIYTKYATGTSGWQVLEVEGEIPSTVSRITLGIVLEGEGKLLVDDARLSIVDQDRE